MRVKSGGTGVQRTQYYPSGLPWASNSIDHPEAQNKKYNGKEFVEIHGYDTYDYGARGYFAATGRFMSVDPLCEKYYNISPYVYCHNNPVRFIDPDGRADGDPNKIEFKLPNLSDYVHGVLATIGLNIQAPKGDTEDAAREADSNNTQQAKTRKEIKDNLKQEARNTADNLETGGITMQAGGYVLAPITAGESFITLVPLGKAVETTGSVMNTFLDLADGKTGKVAANVVSTVAFGTVGRKVGQLSNIGKIGKNDNVLLQLIIDVHAKITSVCTNFISDKNNNNVQK